ETARGAKRSPVHAQLAAAGARFRDVSGWEGADWYGTVEDDPLTWGRPAWFGQWAAEHRAVREGVGLMDMSFMAKFLVQGRDAGAVLDHLSAGDVDGEAGRVTYTQWLNTSGRLEADLTVTKLDAERYWVVASDTAHRHVETLIRRALGFGALASANATVTDVTSGWAQLNLQGPRSRDLLTSLTSADVSDAAFPFRAARTIDLGYAQVLCLRITYLGELGYELYVPAEHAVEVYQRVVAAGAAFGLRHAGLKALSSLRMEKAYRDYGHDIDNTDTVVEAGLGFAVALTRADGAARDFIGRAAVEAQRAAGPPSSRLVQVLVGDPQPLLYHGEVLRRDGVEVGYLRAASYGHTLGGAVGLAMVSTPSGEPVTKAWLDGGTWDVDIVDRRYPVTVSLRPLYDPTSARVKA
ncbi:MAG: aminomethyltransferase family protein, partial [Kineosporiaceae bacterium]